MKKAEMIQLHNEASSLIGKLSKVIINSSKDDNFLVIGVMLGQLNEVNKHMTEHQRLLIIFDAGRTYQNYISKQVKT